MSSIDQRIVEIKFNNDHFERNVQTTLSTLEKLKDKLDFKPEEKNLQSLKTAGDGIDFATISNSLEVIKDRFSTMGIVGMTILQELTRTAMDLGKKLLDLSIGQIISGGSSRAKNLEQARFQFANLGVDAEKALESANKSVLGTMFGFDAAAKAGSQLAATGIDVGDSLYKALRGTAGLATMTGSSFEDISHIMTTIAGNGRLMGDQLRRFGMRGLNVAAILGAELGKSEAEIREMVRKGQIGFELFSEIMYEKFGEAATEASGLYSGAVAHARAALSRIGGTFAPVIFDNMRDFLLELRFAIDKFHNILKPFLPDFEQFVNFVGISLTNMLKKFDPAPLHDFILALRSFGIVIGMVLAPLGKAFIDIFPPMSMDRMMAMTKGMRDLGNVLVKNMRELQGPITNAFRGFFAVIDIGVMFVSALFKAVWELVKAFAPAGRGIIELSGSFGEFLVGIRDVVKESDIFRTVFMGIADAITPIAKAIGDAFTAIIDKIGLFKKADTKPIDEFGKSVDKGFKPLKLLGDTLTKVGEILAWAIRGITPLFTNLAGAIAKGFHLLKDTLKNALRKEDVGKSVDILNAGLFGALILTLRNFVKKIKDFKVEFSGIKDIVDNIKDIFGMLGTTLGEFQKKLKADTLKSIAVAIGLLAASVLVLSLIDPERLRNSLMAIGVLLTELFTSMAIFEKVMSGKGFKSMTKVTLGMIALSAAVLLLSFAVKNLSSIDIEELAVGLLGVGILLAELAIAIRMMPDEKKMSVKALGLIGLATSILILSSAVNKMGQIEFNELMKGLLGVGAILAGLSIFINKTDFKGFGVTKAAGILVLSASLLVLATAVKQFASIDTSSLIKGLLGVAAVLTTVSIFVKSTGDSKKVVSTAIGMNLLGTAMILFSKALESMGGMSWEELGKGLLGMVGALTAMTVALHFIQGAIGGAAALLIVTAALALFVPVLKSLGEMSLAEIAQALLVLTASLVILGGAAMILSPVAPVIVAIGAAFALLGAGITALSFGSVISAIAASFNALAYSISKVGFIEFVKGLMSLLPEFVKSLVQGLVEIIKGIAEAAPAILDAVVKILVSISKAIIEAVPSMAKAIKVFLTHMLDLIIDITPKLVEAGMTLILSLLRGISNNIGRIVKVVSDFAVRFMGALSNELPRIIDAGFKFIIAFINGLAKAIDNNTPKMIRAMGKLVKAVVKAGIDGFKAAVKSFVGVGGDLIKGLISGITGGVGSLVKSVKNMANSAIKAAKNIFKSSSPSKVFIGIGEDVSGGLAIGVKEYSHKVTDEIEDMGEDSIDTMSKIIEDLLDPFDDDPDFNPTITPVFDMSGMDEIDDAFSDKRIDVKGHRTATSIAKDMDSGSVENSTVTNEFTVYATVREEADIKKVAKELNDLQTEGNRGRRGKYA
ncbi:MAG TPA: hypothetical protein VFD57_03625 [Clostridia bacterium]|nr:hypothetical protein [Clostridia bacterium]